MSDLTEIEQSEVKLCAEKIVSLLVAAEATFSAYTVTQILRETGCQIFHADIRSIFEELGSDHFENVGYSVEYAFVNGANVKAKVYARKGQASIGGTQVSVAIGDLQGTLDEFLEWFAINYEHVDTTIKQPDPVDATQVPTPAPQASNPFRNKGWDNPRDANGKFKSRK